jgi:uncharacterized Tic20 family protein
MTSKPARPEIGPWAAGRRPADAWIPTSDGEARTAMFAYLAAIISGPLIPLVVYLAARRGSWYLRVHTATALNLALTGLLYLICCTILGGLLALDSLTVALVVAGAIASFLWVMLVGHLIRGSSAANRGEPYTVAAWLCAQLAKP